MSEAFLIGWLYALLPGVLLGLIGGIAYFAHLRWTTQIYLDGASALRVTAISLARIAGALLLFAFLAKNSAAATLGGLLGFLGARKLVIAWTEFS
jgi:hypothetical protein